MTQSTTETASAPAGEISGFNVSPVSLSLTNSYRLTTDKQFIWTGYWTYYLKTNIETTVQTIKADYPVEYGFNFYYRQLVPQYNFLSVFGGFDYESFSFFDIPAFINNSSVLTFNRYNLFFATLGVSHTFVVKNNIISIKGSLSQTLSSSTDGIEDKMRGQKYQATISFRPGFKSFLFYNVFLSHYALSHSSDTSITRAGVGLSYFIQ